jgi:hypothetical protein
VTSSAVELADEGGLTLELLLRSDWVARRVETVRFLDSTRLERRISLDLDIEELGRLCATQNGASGRVLLPLIVLEKGLLLDLDITADAVGASIATSDDDSRAATGALLRTLVDANVDVSALSSSILRTIQNATRAMPSELDLQVLRDGSAEAGTVDAWRLVEDPNLSEQENEDEAATWTALLAANDDFWSLLRNFTKSFMLMTDVDLDDLPRVIKIRYVETQDPAEMDLATRMGLAPYLTLVEAPGVATAKREHLRIEAPPGVVIEEAALWSIDDRFDPGLRALPTSADRTYQRRLTLDRVAIYTAKAENSDYAVAVSMRANPSGFLRRSQYVLVLGFLMLTLGAIFELVQCTLTEIRTNNADPTVALLVLVPTLLVAYVAREGDHETLGDLLRVPRLLVASTGLVTLASAVALVAGVPHRGLALTWLVAAVWVFVVMVWLRRVNYLSRSTIAMVRANQGATTLEPLTIFTAV